MLMRTCMHDVKLVCLRVRMHACMHTDAYFHMSTARMCMGTLMHVHTAGDHGGSSEEEEASNKQTGHTIARTQHSRQHQEGLCITHAHQLLPCVYQSHHSHMYVLRLHLVVVRE